MKPDRARRAAQPPKNHPAPNRRELPTAVLLAAILALAWLAYSNSFHAALVYDNNGIILQDPRVHAVTPVALHRILGEQYWARANTGLYRPLATLSYLFDYAVMGDGADPFGYHVFNFLLHALNVLLVYALARTVFERRSPALFACALWAVHPVLTESVTNVIGRADLLAAAGVLAALLCHRRAQAAAGARRALWLAALALAAAVGIFSKESGIVVVGVFAVYDFLLARGAAWKTRLPGYAAAALPCLIYLAVRARVLAAASYQPTVFVENPLLGAGFLAARLTAVKVIGQYFALLVWPARLSWDYSYNQVPVFRAQLTGDTLVTLAALAGTLAALAAAWRWRETHKPAAFAIGFFFVTLAPVSNILLLIGTIKAERFLYLPSIGFAILAVWAVGALGERYPALRPACRYALPAAILLLLCRTYVRNEDWRNERSFWLSGPIGAPDSYRTNMAAAVNTVPVSDADVARSLAYAEHGLAIVAGLPDAENAAEAYSGAGTFYDNLGDRAAARGNPAEAQSWYRKAIVEQLHAERITLDFDRTYRAENAAHGKPGLTALNARLYLEIGRTYLRLGDTAHAQAAFERGRALESLPDLLVELASLYRTAGDPHRAAQALVEALAVNPERSDVIPTLADLYGQIDPHGCAVSREGGAVSLNQDCPLVHDDICSASRNVIANYLRRGQHYEADSIRRIAQNDLHCALRP